MSTAGRSDLPESVAGGNHAGRVIGDGVVRRGDFSHILLAGSSLFYLWETKPKVAASASDSPRLVHNDLGVGLESSWPARSFCAKGRLRLDVRRQQRVLRIVTMSHGPVPMRRAAFAAVEFAFGSSGSLRRLGSNPVFLQRTTAHFGAPIINSWPPSLAELRQILAGHFAKTVTYHEQSHRGAPAPWQHRKTAGSVR